MGALLPLPSHFLSLCHGGVGGVRLLHTIAASYNFYYISANRVIVLTSLLFVSIQIHSHTNAYSYSSDPHSLYNQMT